jgi:hypothetical protein
MQYTSREDLLIGFYLSDIVDEYQLSSIVNI